MSKNTRSGNIAASALPQAKHLAYPVKEAAELLGIHFFSVYRMIEHGELGVRRGASSILTFDRMRGDRIERQDLSSSSKLKQSRFWDEDPDDEASSYPKEQAVWGECRASKCR